MILLLLISCTSNRNIVDFSKDGVSFSYLSSWSITEQEELDDSGYYLSVEKNGIDESGLITITWFQGYIDSKDYIEILQNEYENQILLNDLEFDSSVLSTFNGIESISCDFHFSVLGINHKGKVYVFSRGNRTFSIVRQEAIEDISKNKEGFELIESSLKIQ